MLLGCNSHHPHTSLANGRGWWGNIWGSKVENTILALLASQGCYNKLLVWASYALLMFLIHVLFLYYKGQIAQWQFNVYRPWLSLLFHKIQIFHSQNLFLEFPVSYLFRILHTVLLHFCNPQCEKPIWEHLIFFCWFIWWLCIIVGERSSCLFSTLFSNICVCVLS